MNHCYYCETIVDRLESDGKQHICEECKKRYAKEAELREKAKIDIANWWNLTPDERQQLMQQVQPQQPTRSCIVILHEDTQA